MPEIEQGTHTIYKNYWLMKKFALLLIASLLLIPSVTSCLNDDEVVDTWTEYAEWRETNDAWLEVRGISMRVFTYTILTTRH